jgi:hypothetical protein
MKNRMKGVRRAGIVPANFGTTQSNGLKKEY